MAEALAMIESTQQVGDKFLHFQLNQDYSSPFALWSVATMWDNMEPISEHLPFPFHLHVHMPPLRYLFNAFVVYGSLQDLKFTEWAGTETNKFIKIIEDSLPALYPYTRAI